ncbi:YicC/YloC family endoribonuclease [Actibacterium sp. 188UL27-1]|uniref:YicC/YloC family endoribonuclease n=1 Tax=Actibacterium sp. 188UL27-1 TaxID=2786961 RepID=UPI00195DDC39|nr:YicC/YloC family endoribonuclease [Actibacterium sp. 188UL27-1]MBM7066775.1 YicC family protein [Actibacterium sp. 188UL27-1]
MVNSMTGFSAHSAAGAGHSWAWDLRAVNGKGLDLRLRLPDWVDGLEPQARKVLSGTLARGSVTLSLRVTVDQADSDLRLNKDALARALTGLAQVNAAATERGVSLAAPSAVDILNLRGVQEAGAAPENLTALRKALLADLDVLVERFQAMRASEGAALQALVVGQLQTISGLIDQARSTADATQDGIADKLRLAVDRLLNTTDALDAGRLEQEVALIAVKADITEELDRLTAHVSAAQDLLTQSGGIGRKLDFLCQEFNREANTLCSKSQSVALTRIGLDLKTVIDQMREQVQNIE